MGDIPDIKKNLPEAMAMAAFAGPDIEKNLPEAMAMAAFAGISFYIGAEINLSLFLLFKRRRGLYFWACALCSWGVILQPLFILLADFGVWTELRSSITMIYATWLIMVVPQSWILYSRLHLIMRETAALRWIKIVLIFTSIALSVPTTVAGILAQAVLSDAKFIAGYSIWDRFEVAGFFVQETLLSLLYIYKTHKHLRDVTVLSRSRHFVDPPPGGPGGNGGGGAQQGDDADADADKDDDDDREVLQLMCHLIGSNVLVIALDAALLGIQFAELFYLQGAFKPCVYGVKLKVEFAILNRLVESVRARGAGFDQELDHQDRHHHHYGGRGVSPSSSQAYVVGGGVGGGGSRFAKGSVVEAAPRPGGSSSSGSSNSSGVSFGRSGGDGGGGYRGTTIVLETERRGRDRDPEEFSLDRIESHGSSRWGQ